MKLFWACVGYKQTSIQFVLALFLLGFFSNHNYAQSQTLPDWLNPQERLRIEKEHKEQDHVEAVLKVSLSRLEIARSNLQTQNYEEASNEIKNYGSLIDYTVTFINNCGKKEGDKKKFFKILDLSLRRDIAMLDAFRYELPGKYSDEATVVYDRVRKVRTIALGMLFGKDFFPTDDK